MADTACGPGFPQKSGSGCLISEVTWADNLERSEPSQVDIKGLIGDSHGAATQLEQRSIFVPKNLIMPKAACLGLKI
jgi:hypothetical protein